MNIFFYSVITDAPDDGPVLASICSLCKHAHLLASKMNRTVDSFAATERRSDVASVRTLQTVRIPERLGELAQNFLIWSCSSGPENWLPSLHIKNFNFLLKLKRFFSSNWPPLRSHRSSSNAFISRPVAPVLKTVRLIALFAESAAPGGSFSVPVRPEWRLTFPSHSPTENRFSAYL